MTGRKTPMGEAGESVSGNEPTHGELREFDHQLSGKWVSSDDWASDTDIDARIAKMREGTSRLANKAEHAFDIDTNVIVVVEIYDAEEPDTETLDDTMNRAQMLLLAAGGGDIREVVVARGITRRKG